ncbi:MAG: hypothetical protein WCO79_01755 [bacterium]
MLPDAPGVYFFVASTPPGAKKDVSTSTASEILYIGRATSLRDRVRSYFNDDVIQSRGPLIVDMVFHAEKIDFVRTDSVLEAILLEANLIKQHQPRYNTKEKSDKSFNSIVITSEAFPRVLIMRNKDIEIEARAKVGGKKIEIASVFGPYSNGTALREGLKIIRKIFPFRDRCVPCVVDTTSANTADKRISTGRPCFNRQIGLCPGICTGEISSIEYKKSIARLKLFLEGKKGQLMKQLEQDMSALAKAQRFEEANEVKRMMFALNHIQDVGLIREQDESPRPEHGGPKGPEAMFRIEAYDVAHMSGKNTVGVMTVLEDRQLRRSEYRMFKIKRTVIGEDGVKRSGLMGTSADADDIASLREILSRRLTHTEWTFPNLIVVDGSTAQKRAAEKVLREGGFDIAVVGVVKNDKHRPERILAAPQHQKLAKKWTKEILLLNSEAHRFAIKYHRKVRGRLQ